MLLGFLCRKRVFVCSRSGLFNLRCLFAPAKCLELFNKIRGFRGDSINIWLFIKKSCISHVLHRYLSRIKYWFLEIFVLISPMKEQLFVEHISVAFSEQCQTSKMGIFCKTVNGFQSLTISVKSSVLDIWQGSEYASTSGLLLLTEAVTYRCSADGTKYSRMDQVKFVEDRPYPFRFFKGCLPQILPGPFLNTLPYINWSEKLCMIHRIINL